MSKGQIKTASLTEGWSEGSRVQFPVISDKGNNLYLTQVRQTVWAARPLNAPAESGQGAPERDLKGC